MTKIRSTIAAILAGLAISAHADTPKQITIPAGDLVVALETLAKQSDVDLVYQAEQLRGVHTKGINATLTTQDAVRKLLEGTQLRLRTDDATGAMMIAPAAASNERPIAAAPGSKNQTEPSRSRWRVAQADTSSSPAAGAEQRGTATGRADVASAPREASLEEIIVTAQKRGNERLQDVPLPVSVIDASDLASSGQVLLRDYFARVPGFRVVMGGSTQVLSIRGVTTGSGNPTVAFVIDDAPYGGSTSRLGAGQVPDIDPGDLARVEVLRGPQGTLYGAASMGGLLKFVTKDPSTDEYSGRIETGVSSVSNADDVGYSLRGSVNVPLSDTLAVRASGFTRREPGYIDNVFLGHEGINELRADGGRVSALWRPSDNFSLKLASLYQRTRGDGQSSVYRVPGLSGFQRNDIAGVGPYERITQSYSALLNAKFGSLDLTSVTAYNIMRFDDSQNYSSAIPAQTALTNFGVTGSGLWSHFDNDRFVQELRLSAPLGERFEWLAGVFYNEEEGPYHQDVYALDAATGRIAGQWGDLDNPGDYEEYAVFANLTWNISERFDIQLGARNSHATLTGSTTQIGIPPVVNNSPVIIPKATAKEDTFTYLVTPRFKVSPDLMLYARLATGYRPGGFNRALQDTPLRFDPDTTTNYELGMKAELLDQRVAVDASVYYIDWKDVQINLTNGQGFNYLTNTARAKSQGVELSVETRPLDGMKLAAWVSYDDAVLTENFPPFCVAGGPRPCSSAYGVSGNPLPFNSEWSGSVSLQQDFPLTDSLSGYFEGVVSYVGERTGNFRGMANGLPQAREIYPSYTQTDLSAGLTYDAWTLSLFVNNVTDRRGLLSGGAGFFPSISYFYIRPRTIGLNVAKEF